MLFTSEIYVFPFIDDEQLSCIVRTQHYPYIYSIVVLLVQFILINILFFLLLTCFLLLPPCFPDHHHLINEIILLRFNERDERDGHGIILLKKEIIFTFIYIFFALVYQWFGLMNNDEYIISRNCYRWLIEASTIPFILLRIFSNYCMGYIYTFFDECESCQICGMILKVPLFFLMRYAENQPYCFVKDMEGWIFYALCKSSS